MAWRGTFQGKEKVPAMALEAVVDSRLWFWHAYFGMPSANNDLNVLDHSPLFRNLLNGTAPEVKFTVDGVMYMMGYYLANGIYPDWKIIVKTISDPEGCKKQYFATKQEAQRKDIKGAFSVLQVSH